jgi:hypothetical protein
VHRARAGSPATAARRSAVMVFPFRGAGPARPPVGRVSRCEGGRREVSRWRFTARSRARVRRSSARRGGPRPR